MLPFKQMYKPLKQAYCFQEVLKKKDKKKTALKGKETA